MSRNHQFGRGQQGRDFGRGRSSARPDSRAEQRLSPEMEAWMRLLQGYAATNNFSGDIRDTENKVRREGDSVRAGFQIGDETTLGGSVFLGLESRRAPKSPQDVIAAIRASERTINPLIQLSRALRVPAIMEERGRHPVLLVKADMLDDGLRFNAVGIPFAYIPSRTADQRFTGLQRSYVESPVHVQGGFVPAFVNMEVGKDGIRDVRYPEEAEQQWLEENRGANPVVFPKIDAKTDISEWVREVASHDSELRALNYSA